VLLASRVSAAHGQMVARAGAWRLLLAGLSSVLAALAAGAACSAGAQRRVPLCFARGHTGAVLLSGALWTWLAASLAMRRAVVDALRSE
jgi:hypothetical protein